MTDAVHVLGDLQALDIPPGSTLVLMIDRQVSMEESKLMCTVIERACPGHPVLVLDGGVKVGAISTPDPDRLERIEHGLQMVASQLLNLVNALSDDPEEESEQARDLDGTVHGGERKQDVSLDDG
jgi:hypothetical protein